MSDCENCLYFDIEERAESLIYGTCRCGHWRDDDEEGEDCPEFSPLPKGACCARCSHCDRGKTRCKKHHAVVYAPDATPCRDYDCAREEEQEESNTPLLPGIECTVSIPEQPLFAYNAEEPVIVGTRFLEGELLEAGDDFRGEARLEVELFLGCKAEIYATREQIATAPWCLYKNILVEYTVDREGRAHLVRWSRKEARHE